MTERENAFLLLNHQKPAWLPDGSKTIRHFHLPILEQPQDLTCRDSFGVHWTKSASVGYGCHYTYGQQPIVSDITCWQESVVFPNLDVLDWSWISSVCPKKSDDYLVSVSMMSGIFERVSLLMPFDDALVNYLLEPEAMYELLGAIADYKICLIERVAEFIRPDIITLYDDWGSENALFISVDTWRKLIKPHTKRMYDAVKAYGITLIQHSCGHVQELLGDIAEMGAEGWESYQSCNDLNWVKEIYGNRLFFIGTPDIRHLLSSSDQSDETIRSYFETLIRMLGRGGGYLPYSRYENYSRYSAILAETIEHMRSE